ncbi:MAG TPA: YDG/SRA domain-containing protein [Naasia sp.]|jgi:putative restriction endonuclease
MERFFGTPDGVHVGQLFIDRAEVREARVHMPLQSGISGTASEGADSIVVSGGYIDDEDHGDWLIYTGHGGKAPGSNRQIADQSPDASGNAGLITSMVQGLPVRVVRGQHKGSPYSPRAGYVYAGLFTVSSHWMDVGRDGFLIARYRLDRIPEQAPLVTRQPPDLDPVFATATVSRRVRDTALSRSVKALYGYRCQLCGTAVPGYERRLYAEGAHVKPLGRPHLGRDSADNVICLCPNHHTQLDMGGMVILDDYRVSRTDRQEVLGRIDFAPGHMLSVENALYHRNMWLSTRI